MPLSLHFKSNDKHTPHNMNRPKHIGLIRCSPVYTTSMRTQIDRVNRVGWSVQLCPPTALALCLWSLCCCAHDMCCSTVQCQWWAWIGRPGYATTTQGMNQNIVKSTWSFSIVLHLTAFWRVKYRPCVRTGFDVQWFSKSTFMLVKFQFYAIKYMLPASQFTKRT